MLPIMRAYREPEGHTVKGPMRGLLCYRRLIVGQPIVVQSRYERLCVVALPLRERGFEVGEGLHAGPFVFGRSTKDTMELLRKKNLELVCS